MRYMYDKYKLGKRISDLRKKRWTLYKTNMKENPNPYEKFVCCSSQESFAEVLEVERRAVSSWETGANSPSLENLVKICDILECNIDYLLGADNTLGISPIALASKYSGISSTIIEYGKNNSAYLDCLNYFMNPDNCSELFNSFTLTTWKEFLNNNILEEIYDPLKSLLINAFQNYQAFTPFKDYCIDGYKKKLLSALPKEKISFSQRKHDTRINVKVCINPKLYNKLELSPQNINSYDILIDYLSEHVYDTLFNKSLVEFQKEKIGKSFVKLIDRYLEE